MKIGNFINLGNVYDIHDNEKVIVTSAGAQAENAPKDEAQRQTETSEIVDVVPVEDEGEPTPEAVDYTQSPLYPYLLDPGLAGKVIPWLHEHIDSQTREKERLMPLYAVSEHGYFRSSIPHKVYMQEFGEIKQQAYSKWMGPSSTYSDEELQNLWSTLD